MLVQNLILLLAVSGAATAAPTAAQHKQALADWKKIWASNPIQVGFACKYYLPKREVTSTKWITSTTGTSTVTKNGVPTYQTVKSGVTAVTLTTTINKLTTSTSIVRQTTSTSVTVTAPTVTVTDCLDGDSNGFNPNSKRTAVPVADLERRRLEMWEILFDRIKTTDPDYLSTVCAQVQSERFLTTKKVTVIRGTYAHATTTINPTRLTTVASRTITRREYETSTSTVRTTATSVSTRTSTKTVTPTFTSTSMCPPPPGPTPDPYGCTVGYMCGGDPPVVSLPSTSQPEGTCFTGVDGVSAFCGIDVDCESSCDNDPVCGDGWKCAFNTCCGDGPGVCVRPCSQYL